MDLVIPLTCTTHQIPPRQSTPPTLSLGPAPVVATTFPIETAEPETEKEEQLAPLYNVILFDDDEHSYAYVVEMMMNLFSMSPEEGFNIAYEVDHIGQAVVITRPYEEALSAQRKIINYGPDYRMETSRGSMGCTIEPATD